MSANARGQGRLRRGAAAAALACACGAAAALGGQNMVLGRMVPARSDAPSVAATSSPRAHYVLHCAGCHGLDGAGSRAAQVPDMRRLGDWLRVPGGREFVVGVPGVAGSGLDDAQVAELTNWVLATIARGSAPAGTPRFTAEEVARVRTAPIVDVAATRRALVAKAQGLGVAID